MASITITFSKTAGTKDIVIELDDEKNGDKSEFRYGEKAYFKVYADPALDYFLTSTDGTITEEGEGQEIVEDDIEFLEEQEKEVKKPCLSLVSYEWLGNSLGQIQKTGLFTLKAQKKPEPTGTNGIGLARVRYNTQFKRYAISVPEKDYDEYPVIVYVGV